MRWIPWRFRSRPRTERSPWPLDRRLLSLGEGDEWTIRSAVEGSLILGATGSGKSSGPGDAIREAILAAEFGGLVFTVKSDEREAWEAACKKTNRLSDLRVFSSREPLRFNFLDFERTREGSGAGLTENIVRFFSEVMEVSQRDSSGGGRDDDRYWVLALRQLLRNLIDLCLISGTAVSVPNLYRLAVSAPTTLDQLASDEWKAQSFCFDCLRKADAASKEDFSQTRDFELVADFFTLEWPNLSEKTRSIVLSCFTSMADLLNRGVLRELFCGETNIDPSVTEQGKIILIDMPVKEFGAVGQIAQVLWKVAFQRSIERRDVRRSPRPVFLFADEAQHFVTSQDQMFQTTCRASRVATVYLSQNVSNFYAALGKGEAGKAEADSLFGNLNTKILCANGDPVTNEWASSLIGRTKQVFVSGNTSRSTDWTGSMLGLEDPAQNSSGFHEAFEFELQPAAFTRLRNGGPRNRNMVDAIVVRSGRVFESNARIWKPVTFRQQ